MTIDEIKNGLINSCLNGNAKSFIPFLLAEKVETGMPNKTRFYRFFKHMLDCSKCNSIGEWDLQIENADWMNEKNSLAYNFFDKVHKYARLTLMIRENNERIYIETMPF